MSEIHCLFDRGAGYTFGSHIVERFLDANKMSHILRAHQLCNAGYQVLFNDQLSTVWSAPNYCYRCGNLASILEVGVEGERYFNVFDAAPENDKNFQTNVQKPVSYSWMHMNPYSTSELNSSQLQLDNKQAQYFFWVGTVNLVFQHFVFYHHSFSCIIQTTPT